MKKTFVTFAIAIAALVNASIASQVTITDFGTGQLSASFSDFTDTQTATTYRLVGFDSYTFVADLPSPVSISETDYTLTLTATFAGTATSNFQLQLVDVDGDSLLYSSNYTNFLPSVETNLVMSLLSQEGTFNGTVVSIALIPTVLVSTGSVDITMNKLTAGSIPEPAVTTVLSLGAALLGLRRRR